MTVKYIPRVGTKFNSRQDLLNKLEDAGWKFEGEGQGFAKGCGVLTSLKDCKITSMDLGVIDEKNDLWLWIDMKPLKDGVKIVKVNKLKLSDYDEGGKYDTDKKIKKKK